MPPHRHVAGAGEADRGEPSAPDLRRGPEGLLQKGAYSGERRFSACRTRRSRVRGLRPEIDGSRSILSWKCQARSGGLCRARLACRLHLRTSTPFNSRPKWQEIPATSISRSGHTTTPHTSSPQPQRREPPNHTTTPIHTTFTSPTPGFPQFLPAPSL